jgi:hypothetical protein
MKRLLLTCLLASLAIGGSAAAQSALNEGQGHPLKGTWLGDWGPDKTHRTLVLIDMDWDGKAVSATLNPGADAVRFTKAELDHTNWSVHLAAESKGVRYQVDGTIENLGLARRSIVGTWMQGNQKGTFKITRQ